MKYLILESIKYFTFMQFSGTIVIIIVIIAVGLFAWYHTKNKVFKTKYIENVSQFMFWIGICLTFISIVLFLNSSKLNYNLPIDTDKFSHFGDFMGGIVGVVVNLCSVLLFYLALTEQRIETKQQGYESNFFQLMKLHETLVTQINQKSWFGTAINEFKKNEAAIRQDPINKRPTNFKDVITEYVEIRKYCLFFEQFIKFVLNEDIDNNLKQTYLNIFKSQLSDAQITIILYYIIEYKATTKFNAGTAKKYNFFEYINKKSIHKDYIVQVDNYIN
jgi:Co/Zn/Cd efflux system component